MRSGKEPLGKKAPSNDSLNELMQLLLKLNAQLRKKVAPSQKKKGTEAGNIEMVIIILNSSVQDRPRTPRTIKRRPPESDWIDGLCEDIEKE